MSGLRRRDFLKASVLAAGGASLATGCATPSLRAGEPSPDLATAAGRARAFLLMRGALDGRVVIGNLVGTYSGVVDQVMSPLYGLMSATFAQYRRFADGGFAIVSFEQAYYTTLDGTAVLATLANPYTGRTVPVPVWSAEPTIQFVTADLRFSPASPAPTVRFEQGARAAVSANADDVTFVEQLSSGVLRDGRYRGYSELVTLRASRRAFGEARVAQVRSTTSYSSIVAWRSWLEMGDRAGHLMGHGVGGYGIAADDLPPLFVAETLRRRPEALSDPAALLAPALQRVDALRPAG